jgi:hypothetical protein
MHHSSGGFGCCDRRPNNVAFRPRACGRRSSNLAGLFMETGKAFFRPPAGMLLKIALAAGDCVTASACARDEFLGRGGCLCLPRARRASNHLFADWLPSWVATSRQPGYVTACLGKGGLRVGWMTVEKLHCRLVMITLDVRCFCVLCPPRGQFRLGNSTEGAVSVGEYENWDLDNISIIWLWRWFKMEKFWITKL